jgi:hypothetical protein
MPDFIGILLNCIFFAAVAWAMISTLRAIYRDIGFTSTRGFLWALAVIFGTLFGVILYRFFRGHVESLCATLFARW